MDLLERVQETYDHLMEIAKTEQLPTVKPTPVIFPPLVYNAPQLSVMLPVKLKPNGTYMALIEEEE